MIAHYLTSALANFRKSPFTTAADVLTLALGLACFIAAFGIATYWRSADGYHADAERTFLIGQGFAPQDVDAPIPVGANSTAALARHIPSDFPEVEQAARAFAMPKVPLAAGERKALLDAAFVEPAFLDLFDFEFLAGDPARALAAPGSLVLTQEAAERLFGGSPALGRTVLVDGDTSATVTGVIAAVRQPSFMGSRPESTLRFEALAHWDLLGGGAMLDAEEQWFSNQVLTFVRLTEGASLAAINARMADFVERRMPPAQQELVGVRLEAMPLGEITTREIDNDLFAVNGLKLTTVGVLLGLGVLILVVAGVNYANLSTAQASLSAKEIGMRKVLGAGRAATMAQSWLATLVQTLAALVVALAALLAAGPVVKTAMGVDLLYFLSAGAEGAVLILALVVVVALAAGAYPALVLARVRPARALRSARARSGPRFVARILVGVQFATASFLLILLAVSQMQRTHLEAIVLAPQEDPIVILNEIQSAGIDAEALTTLLKQNSGVKEVAVTDRPPWMTGGSLLAIVKSPEAEAQQFTAYAKHVGQDYFATMGSEVLAGRSFDRAHETAPASFTVADPAQPVPMVIDETLARSLGFASPQAAVGQTVFVPVTVMRMVGGSAAQPATIVGVVETDVTRLGAKISNGHLYLYGPNSPLGNGLFPIVRLAREDVAGSLAAIEAAFDQLAPNVPADVRFFDQMFEENYRQFSRIGQLFTILATIAFVISSLGLLGIAVHVAARRRHEIAVRKTLGSTTWGAVRLLLADFSKPVLIGNLIAWPLGYLAAQTYLSAFAHRIELSIWPFALSMLITLAIAWLAVGGQTYRAASVRPAQVLRDA